MKPEELTSNEKLVDKLNELLAKNYDAESGYKNASEDVEDAELKSFFRSYSEQRYSFGHDIKAEIRALGGTPEKGTEVKGDIHRRWMDLRSALSSNEEETVLKECIRGENAALEEYNEMLEYPTLPATTREIITRHANGIREAINSLQKLEKEYSH